MTRRSEQKRLEAINKTIELCSLYGFHGTSIDRITSATGLSKATIYKYFSSKENLIALSLTKYSETALLNFNQLMEDTSLSLEERLNARLDRLSSLVEQGCFQGCFFQLAFSEYCNSDRKIADICLNYKRSRVQRMTYYLEIQKIKEAKEKAEIGEMIINGLLASLHLTQDVKLIESAKALYKQVILS